MGLFILFLGQAFGFALLQEGNPCARIVLALLSLLVFFLSIKKRLTKVFLLSFCLGLLLGFLMGIPMEFKEGRQVGIVVKRGENYVLLRSFRGLVYVKAKGHEFGIGDWLAVEGKLSPLHMTNYESRFDFGVYLQRYGVKGEVENATISPLFLFPIRLVKMENNYLSHYDNSARTLLSSILFNRRDNSSEIFLLLEEMNLVYLFSASGIFFSKLLSFLRKTLRKFIAKKETAEVALLLVSFLFIPLGARKIGIAKGLVSLWLSTLLPSLFKRRFSRLEILSVSALVQMFITPFSLFQTGFLLSYGISFAFYFRVEKQEEGVPRFFKKLHSLLFVQAIALPVSMNAQGRFHLFAPLFSFALTPLLLPFAFLGLLGFFAFPLPSLLNPYAEFLVSAAKVCREIDYACSVPKWGPLVIFLYYVALLLFLYGRELVFPSLKKGAAFSFLTIYCLSLLPFSAPFLQEVFFINVGQGDAILIRDRFTTVLIDTGGNLGFDMAEEVLIPFFRKQRIQRIDCLIASHRDFDHIGAKESLEDHFPVASFVEGMESFPLSVNRLRFENFNVFSGQEENDASLVLKLEFMDKTWLFTGDAPIEIEKRILRAGYDVDCDILKIGHHGSSTSTSMEFLLEASPEEAVISVGRNNMYGHPSPAVIERLEARGIKIRRTDVEGSIRYAKWSSPWV